VYLHTPRVCCNVLLQWASVRVRATSACLKYRLEVKYTVKLLVRVFRLAALYRWLVVLDASKKRDAFIFKGIVVHEVCPTSSHVISPPFHYFETTRSFVRYRSVSSLFRAISFICTKAHPSPPFWLTVFVRPATACSYFVRNAQTLRSSNW
jgi:hypothetical protein